MAIRARFKGNIAVAPIVALFALAGCAEIAEAELVTGCPPWNLGESKPGYIQPPWQISIPKPKGAAGSASPYVYVRSNQPFNRMTTGYGGITAEWIDEDDVCHRDAIAIPRVDVEKPLPGGMFERRLRSPEGIDALLKIYATIDEEIDDWIGADPRPGGRQTVFVGRSRARRAPSLSADGFALYAKPIRGEPNPSAITSVVVNGRATAIVRQTMTVQACKHGRCRVLRTKHRAKRSPYEPPDAALIDVGPDIYEVVFENTYRSFKLEFPIGRKLRSQMSRLIDHGYRVSTRASANVRDSRTRRLVYERHGSVAYRASDF